MSYKLAIPLYLWLSTCAFAQSAAGLATISGVVKDPAGSPISNARVEISSESQGPLRALVTNDAGVFTAPALVPGTGYNVTVSTPGFATFEALGITLQVGQNRNLNITMVVAAPTTQVEVNAVAPLVEDTKTDVSAVINSGQIQNLPINGRRVDTFVQLTPGVTNDGTFGLLTFRGVAGHNAFLIDGNDTTEQFYNENAGRTRIATQISQDAVQEFQVVSANFSAEYGRAMGGVVNTVTRSGTNDLHGTAYWFFRNRTLNARDRYAAFNPPEWRHQAGGSAGGALIHDKLFYFFNADFTRRNFPMLSSLNFPNVVDPVSQSFVGCGAPATPQQCAAANSILPRFFGSLPRTADNDLYFGRLDYRPNEKHSFSAGLNYMRFVSPNGIQSAAVSTTGSAIGANGNDSVRVRNGRLDWTFVPVSDLVNEVRFGWTTDRQADTFNNRMVPPGIGVVSLTVAGVSGLGAGANYLPRVQPNETRYQIADNVTWTRGRHSLKAGADIASSRDYSYSMLNQFGFYTYQTVTNFALDFSNQELSPNAGKHWQTFQQTFGNPSVDTTIRDFGFYLQDQWRATDRLTLNLGARYEYARLPQPAISNPDYPQTGRIYSPTLNLAPRVGAAYRLNNTTVLRAGYGIFHARFPGALLFNLFSGNGVYQTAVALQGNNPAQLSAGPGFPNALGAQPAGGNISAANIQFLAPNIKTPYTQQGTVGIEHQFPREVLLTVSYIWSRGVQLYGVRDLNLNEPTTSFTYTIQDANGNPTGSYTTPIYQTPRPDTRYGGVYQVQNGVNSYYNGLAVHGNKRFSKSLTAALSYTWSHSIDDGQGAGNDALFFSSINNYTFPNGNFQFDKGSSRLDQRHRFVFSFVWEPTITRRDGAFWKYVVNRWQLSSITTLASGRPTTATIRTSTPNPVPNMLATTTINGSGGNFRVPFWPVNSLYTPPVYRNDARISKLLPVTEKMTIYLSFEAFNITNTQVDTSLATQAYLASGGVLRLTPNAFGFGTASGGFPDGTNARRAQVSARLVF
jgi:outer membrane receptor protein involved in Fe transport